MQSRRGFVRIPAKLDLTSASATPQHDVKVPIKNDFVDVDSLLTSTAPGSRVNVHPGSVTVKILERVRSFRVIGRAGKKR